MKLLNCVGSRLLSLSGLLLLGMTTTTPAAALDTLFLLGCNDGYVCIYPTGNITYAYPIPGDIYYTYGPHRIYNKIGEYYVKNNQTGGASVKLCTDLNGTKCPNTDTYNIPAGQYRRVDLTPINSINLVK